MRTIFLLAVLSLFYSANANSDSNKSAYADKIKFFNGNWYADVSLESNCFQEDGCTVHQNAPSGVDKYKVKLKMGAVNGIPLVTGSISTNSLLTGNKVKLTKLVNPYSTDSIVFYKYHPRTTYLGVCVFPREEIDLTVTSIANREINAVHRMDWVQCNKKNTMYFSHIYEGPGNKEEKDPTF